MEKEFLVKFNDNQKIVKVEESDNLAQKIKEAFEIKDKTAAFILQNYDKEWDDWIDVSNFDEIPNRTILRCIIKASAVNTLEPKIVSTTESHDNYCSFLNDTDSTETVESDESSSTCSGEMVVGVTLPSLKGKWPDKFGIPENKFSEGLKVALNSEKTLNWSQKRELMEVVASQILKYTDTPNKMQRKQVALELIAKYPYLKEVLGSGTDGWEERIRDKLKIVRRHARGTAASSSRKRSISPSSVATLHQKVSQCFTSYSLAGCLN